MTNSRTCLCLVCCCVCVLCRIVSAPDNVVEVSDPRVDHSAVTREPAGLAALDTIFAKLGMRMGTPAAAAQPVSGPVSNRASG